MCIYINRAVLFLYFEPTMTSLVSVRLIVLHLILKTIVTGAGDETLRFWNVFAKSRSVPEVTSALNLFSQIR